MSVSAKRAASSRRESSRTLMFAGGLIATGTSPDFAASCDQKKPKRTGSVAGSSRPALISVISLAAASAVSLPPGTSSR